MGYGDDIMATAYARQAVEAGAEGHKVVFGHPDTFHDPVTNKLSIHWSEVFLNNPNIVQPGEKVAGCMCFPDFPGHRVYIDYDKCPVKEDGDVVRYTQFIFQDEFCAPKGEFFWTPEETNYIDQFLEARSLTGDFVVLEPTVKGGVGGENKGWSPERWIAVCKTLIHEGHTVVQMGQFDEDLYLKEHGAKTLVTNSFRVAAAILARAKAFGGADGGLHHASAALGVPAVVLWTGYSSPKHLGYDDHINLAHFDLDKPCGKLEKDEWCWENALKIEPAEVCDAFRSILS